MKEEKFQIKKKKRGRKNKIIGKKKRKI